MVGAGAVVTRSVPAHAIVVGNPARIRGYTGAAGEGSEPLAAASGPEGLETLGIDGVHVQRFRRFEDLRGSLTAGEMPTDGIPFTPQRWFLVYDVPGREVRGEHAHRVCHQFLVCVSGRVSVAVDDGSRRAEVLLDSPAVGIYVPPMVWASEYRYEDDAVLLVLASHRYDPDDYIRDYESFLVEVNR
jgi:dTDP-4-dehydrorhamnose 3,5-epimerase-like enzyme